MSLRSNTVLSAYSCVDAVRRLMVSASTSAKPMVLANFCAESDASTMDEPRDAMPAMALPAMLDANPPTAPAMAPNRAAVRRLSSPRRVCASVRVPVENLAASAAAFHLASVARNPPVVLEALRCASASWFWVSFKPFCAALICSSAFLSASSF